MSSVTRRNDAPQAQDAVDSSFSSDRAPPTFAESFTAVAWFGLIWGLGYWVTNWFNSQRDANVAWHHEYEQHIPYFWWMIAPYVSMDVLFALAPFACRTRRDLRLLVWRITAIIAVAATIFVLWPSHYTWKRPQPDSFVQSVFQGLVDLDEPYNAFPSLHVALVLPLARAFRPRSRGLFHGLVRCWFALIVVSTVLTYQHHVLDSTAGLVLGLICRRLVAPDAAMQPITQQWRSFRERWAIGSLAWRRSAGASVPKSASA
jgi:membrane-associated phospholipid phosphatase